MVPFNDRNEASIAKALRQFDWSDADDVDGKAEQMLRKWMTSHPPVLGPIAIPACYPSCRVRLKCPDRAFDELPICIWVAMKKLLRRRFEAHR